MPLIQSGKTFNDGEQLTAGKLNQMFSDASLSTAGVDGTSIIVNANDVLAVRSINSARIDSGAVITDKLPDSTDKTDGVTLPKLQHIETDKILGRTTTGDGVVEAIGLNTDDAMANASATTLATDGSIKAYVDGEITDNGITQTTGSAPYFGVRAWANYNGVADTLNASGNIASVVRNSKGDYTFTFTTAMPDANYSLTMGYTYDLGSAANGHGVGYIYSQTPTKFRVRTYNENNSADPMDKVILNISVIR